MHRCSPVLRLHDHACHRSTLRDISDSLSVRRSTTSSSIASGLHAHNWSRSVDRCKIKCAAPRRWLETVLRGTPCDTASSSAKLGSPVKYRFETPILSGSPVWTRFELLPPNWHCNRTHRYIFVFRVIHANCWQESMAGTQSGHVSNSPRDPLISGCTVIRPQTARIALPFATLRLEFCSLGLLGTVPHCCMGCAPRPGYGRNQGEWPKYHHRYSPPVEPLATHDHRGRHDRR